MRRMHRRRGERGAAAVEAALLTPLIVLLVFGMIEMAFLMKDNVAVTSAARVGARIASASPAAGAAVCDGEVPCSPRTVPRFAQMAADAMQTNGSAIPTNQIDAIWVYEANDRGFPGTATTMAAATCTTKCVRYIWSPRQNAFRYGSGNWQDAATKPCSTQGKRVGVRMMTTHPWITGVPFIPGVGQAIAVDDNAVMTFEPLTLEYKC